MVEPRRSPPPDPFAEALLHLEWARGAVGSLYPADGPRAAPRPPAAAAVPAEVAERMGRIAKQVCACRLCPLAATRTQAVPGEGTFAPRLVVVGEAPGADEDASGRPFVGRAGQLLTRMLAAIGLSREQVFIGNVIKCRPPDNRPPEPAEVAACKPYLLEQLAILKPTLVLALGNHAVRALLGTERGITSLRGRFMRTPEGLRVLPTYHPSYLLRNPASKREAWEDMQKVAADLGLEVPRPPPM